MHTAFTVLLNTASGLCFLVGLTLCFTAGPQREVSNSVAAVSNRKTELGKALFLDKRLSEDRTVSCATCHDPASAFTSREALAVGVGNRKGARNAPTLLNSAFSKSYFWDGRAATLEEQAKQPLFNPSEMGLRDEASLLERVSSIAEYRRDFSRVFPRDGITLNTIATTT